MCFSILDVCSTSQSLIINDLIIHLSKKNLIIPFFVSLRFPKSYYTLPGNSVKIHTHIYTRSCSCAPHMIQSAPRVHQHPKSGNSPFISISCTSSIVPRASLARQNLDIHATNRLEILKHIISSIYLKWNGGGQTNLYKRMWKYTPPRPLMDWRPIGWFFNNKNKLVHLNSMKSYNYYISNEFIALYQVNRLT
jgi:hypothetical protein